MSAKEWQDRLVLLESLYGCYWISKQLKVVLGREIDTVKRMLSTFV